MIFLCGFLAIGHFGVYTPYQMIDGQKHTCDQISRRAGVVVAVIVALITSEIFLSLAPKPKNHHSDAGFCTACGSAFIQRILLPIFLCMVFFSALSVPDTDIGRTKRSYLHNNPDAAQTYGNEYLAVIILGAVGNFLWVLGIHGPNTTSAIRETVFLRLIWRNLSGPLNMALPGARHIRLPGLLNDAFANCGGSGMTLGLLLAIFIASKACGIP